MTSDHIIARDNFSIVNCSECGQMASCVQIVGKDRATGRIVTRYLCRDYCLHVWNVNEGAKKDGRS